MHALKPETADRYCAHQLGKLPYGGYGVAIQRQRAERGY
jgi:hypothetical protein